MTAVLYKSVDLELLPEDTYELHIKYTLPIIWERVQDKAFQIYSTEDEDDLNEKVKELFDLIKLDVI